MSLIYCVILIIIDFDDIVFSIIMIFFLFQGHFLQWFSYVFVFHYFLLIQVSNNKKK